MAQKLIFSVQESLHENCSILTICISILKNNYFIFNIIFFLSFKIINENSELKNKYSNLFKLLNRMSDKEKKNRPYCEQIIMEENLWALYINELNLNTTDSKISKKSEEKFSNHFINIKLNISDKIKIVKSSRQTIYQKISCRV